MVRQIHGSVVWARNNILLCRFTDVILSTDVYSLPLIQFQYSDHQALWLSGYHYCFLLQMA
jgi:hypothetical protein